MGSRTQLNFGELAKRIFDANRIEAKYEAMSNERLAQELLEGPWADTPMFTDYSELIGVVIERMKGKTSGPQQGKNAALLDACKALIDYRDRVGPLNFQLEKADDYIRMMRSAISKEEGGEG